MTNTTETSTELTRASFTDEWMAEQTRGEGASLQTLANAFALAGTDIADDVNDGVFNLDLIEDKEFLNGLPFLITRWRFNTSDKFKDAETGEDGVFVSVEIAYQTSPNSPMTTGVFNDGSTGIMAQLQNITAQRKKSGKGDPYAGRLVKHGLRASVYQRDTGKTHPKTGEPITEQATTYYLNM